jgi:phosphate:Na+ symporter
MKDALLIFLTVAGGLGTFLLGMKHLSEGLQAISGSGLRKFMSLATTHRLAGIGTGILSTTIVQSSSIITVMVVGFVSSGLMNVQQAINVIIGSNIGTTTTAWIIAFAPDVKLLGLSVVMLGSLLYFFLKNERVRNTGLAFMGLGFIFMGLYWMKEGMDPVRDMPAVVEIFKSLDAVTTLGLLKCILVSLVFTVVVQSSAATTAIAMTLAQQGLLSFEATAATVFGMNIGTTITAWLAAFNGSANARRTALAHTLFNIIGTIVMLPLFIPVIVPLTTSLFPDYNVAKIVDGITTYPNMGTPMAAIHTFFNLATTSLFLPFIPLFARLVERLIKQNESEKPHLSMLSANTLIISPVIACDQALLEVNFMRDSNIELLGCVRKILAGEGDARSQEHVFHREDILDNVQREITEFLGKVMLKRLPSPVAERARRLLRLSDELESVSDETATILKVLNRLSGKGLKISETSSAVLLDVHDRMAEFAGNVSTLIVSPRVPFVLSDVQAASKDLHDKVRACRQLQLNRIGPDDPESALRVLGELDILNAYERIRAYYLNIAETLAGGKTN